MISLIFVSEKKANNNWKAFHGGFNMVKKGLIIAVTILSFFYIENAQATNVSYKYDNLSRLVEVLYGNVGKIIYTYDATGNRVSQTVTVINPLIGNVNGDDAVNLTDAILAMQITTGLKPTVYLTGDTNNDGRIGLAEVIYILQKVEEMR